MTTADRPYIVNPINLASLKFSGRFRVFTAYSVHNEIRKRFHMKGVRNEPDDVEQTSTRLKMDLKESDLIILFERIEISLFG